ncbi:CAAX amino terminal protease family protein (plasmid) [Euzebya pacifica]|uniref:CAAX amino terminal protease family protein n=1 Tax=Euzebya pacifica TaxID=1608957 RepID=A0A346Y5W1_9ACTN|nr:CPBP family intramembrane glutamic endopeptidase [Euzebya pacifica]AXV09858.1 CAAX amino terminal protease family protein [Euzebya pacifica]
MIALSFVLGADLGPQAGLLAVSGTAGLGALTGAARHGRHGLRGLIGRVPDLADLGASVRLGVIAWMALTFVLGGAAIGIEQLLDIEILNTNQDDIARLAGGTGPGPAAVAVSIMLAAPICEELLFRGVLLGWAANRWGRTVGTVVSAAVFGAVHAQPYTGLVTALLGAALARMTLDRGGVLPAVVAHATFNTIGFAFIRLTP